MFAAAFNWVPVSVGVWTTLAVGPFFKGTPVVWIELLRAAPGLPNASVNLSLRLHSAAPPFYTLNTFTATAWRQITTGVNPNSGRAPWNSGVPLWLASSPFVEIAILTDRPCLAHTWGF